MLLENGLSENTLSGNTILENFGKYGLGNTVWEILFGKYCLGNTVWELWLPGNTVSIKYMCEYRYSAANDTIVCPRYAC